MSQRDFNCTQYSYLQDFMTMCQSTSKHAQSNREQGRNSEKKFPISTLKNLCFQQHLTFPLSVITNWSVDSSKHKCITPISTNGS